MVLVKEVETKCPSGGFLGFEHVTMVPSYRKLICEEMLTDGENRWLSSYNRKVLQTMEGRF